MQRLRTRFGGLYWRLTGSYFLVTILAALIIEIAVTLPPVAQELQQSGSTLQFARLLEDREAPLAVPYLVGTATNLNDEQALLQHIIPQDIAESDPKGPAVLAISILTSDKQLLISSPACVTSEPTDTTKPAICADPLAQEMHDAINSLAVSSALHTTSQTPDWVGVIADHTLIAVPIRTVNKAIVGALLVILDQRTLIVLHPNTPVVVRFVSAFWNNLQAAGFYFVLLAGVIGTLTGLLITRNVTRRLRRIAQAAEAWSRGEFEVVARDPTRDEIGQLAHDLTSMAEQIQSLLTTRQALVVVEERNRLARDLHDSVKQHMFANALLINAARHLLDEHPEEVNKHLLEAETLAQLAQDELTTLIQALRPAALADKGLVAVVRDYAADWSARMGIGSTLRISGERTTPLAIEEVLLRVLQEGLANVARHSGASQVVLALTWQPEAIIMQIADDGHGFAHQQKPSGIGLTSMQERVAAVGGTFTVTSSSTGTTIQATIPLAASEIVEASQ